jgi:transcription antitermination factor NusB
VVDRNILRLGSYELMFRPDIPPKVSLNEAVELAKKYSGLEVGKFVNGVLDKIKPKENK